MQLVRRMAKLRGYALERGMGNVAMSRVAKEKKSEGRVKPPQRTSQCRTGWRFGGKLIVVQV